MIGICLLLCSGSRFRPEGYPWPIIHHLRAALCSEGNEFSLCTEFRVNFTWCLHFRQTQLPIKLWLKVYYPAILIALPFKSYSHCNYTVVCHEFSVCLFHHHQHIILQLFRLCCVSLPIRCNLSCFHDSDLKLFVSKFASQRKSVLDYIVARCLRNTFIHVNLSWCG